MSIPQLNFRIAQKIIMGRQVQEVGDFLVKNRLFLAVLRLACYIRSHGVHP
jgi:hypothetical protein